MSFRPSCVHLIPKKSCAAIGLALGVSLGAVSVQADVVFDAGVAPHAGIDALYSTLMNAVDTLDASAFPQLYTQDTFYLGPEARLLQGLDEITADWDDWFAWMKDGNGTLEMDFKVIAREVHDDTLGYDIGYSTIVQKRPGEADVTYASKFIVVTQKQPNGEWRFQVDAFNTLKGAE